MSQNPFNNNFDTRNSSERGTAGDFIRSMDAGAWERRNGSAPTVFNNPTTLWGRIAAFVGMGVMIGMFVGGIGGANTHTIFQSFLMGALKGAVIGAVCGVIWNLVMVAVGGVAGVLNLPVLRQTIRGAVFGAIAGAVLAFLNGRVQHPMPTIVLIAVFGAAIGAVVGLIGLGRNAMRRSKSQASDPGA